ncbi:Crp/Fnr family transcriptional regulator [Chitinilyticum litopenaei]|uniref:Crp/Fnr family transcriptional regulator n=1 Tax=Chitinilyticum litopenaei TaxID=1121276 RepID=UPI000684E220|nr:Crp/Fnr family transcriptional regulator [Chitinilyticum litopenaei]
MLSVYHIPLFAGLPELILQRIQSELSVKHYGKNDTVIQKDSKGEELLFLLSGSLQVQDVTRDGHSITIHIIQPGDFFGELAVIDGGVRSTSVSAITPSAVGALGASFALQLLYSHPLLAERMLKQLAFLVRLASQSRAVLAINDTTQRICMQLLRFKKTTAGGVEYLEPPPQAVMAGMCNCSRESVSRAIAKLIQDGLVRKDGKKLLIRDLKGLQLLASHGLTHAIKT